jgi:hypothetical protein
MKKTSIILAVLLVTGCAAVASEEMRQVQEELRKRNLYFGDIDGKATTETEGALRRYQERKGFPASGELCPLTRKSLNLAQLSESAEATNWPEETVLKSDAARRVSEADQKFLEAIAEETPQAEDIDEKCLLLRWWRGNLSRWRRRLRQWLRIERHLLRRRNLGMSSLSGITLRRAKKITFSRNSDFIQIAWTTSTTEKSISGLFVRMSKTTTTAGRNGITSCSACKCCPERVVNASCVSVSLSRSRTSGIASAGRRRIPSGSGRGW